MLRSFFSAVRSVLLIICSAAAAAWLFSSLRFFAGKSVTAEAVINDLFSSFAVILAAMTAICIVFLMLRRRREAAVSSKALENGYTEDFFKYYENKVARARSQRSRSRANIRLTGCYCQAGRYCDAVDALCKVDLSSLSEIGRADYYNTALYTALMSGDRECAEKIYISGKPLFDKYDSPPIYHTLAVLEYMRGNLEHSEEMLLDVKCATSDAAINSECNIYLILIFLKTDRLAEAKALAEQTAPLVCTYQCKQQLLRLMSCIELACKAKFQEMKEDSHG